MIDFLKRLFKIKTDSQLKPDESRHFKNLNSGPKIYLDGKPYVKVKLRFVDTLNFDIAQHLDQLETEIELQKCETEKLSNLKTKYERKIEDLQRLNINLLNEFKNSSKKLEKLISDVAAEKEKKEIYYFDLENSVQFLNESIKDITLRNKLLSQSNDTKEKRIVSLEQEIQWFASKNEDYKPNKRVLIRFRDDLKAAEKTHSLLWKEIENKNSLITNLTNQITEKETIIRDLETKINSLTIN